MKTISSRTLKRGTPEDRLGPGESLLVKKSHGRVFELKRVDAPRKSMLAGHHAVLAEVPNPGAHGPKTDVAKWCQDEDL